MGLEERKDFDKTVDELHLERDDLENQIRKLNILKIQKLETINDEIEKKAEWMDKERIKAIKERDNLLRKVRQSNEKNWKHALIMASILVAIDLIIIPLIISLLGIQLHWIFLSMGVVTFFGVLLLVNYMSGSSPFNTGEIRKAITVTLITVYLAFVPLIALGTVTLSPDISTANIITNFSWIIGVVILLYFSTRPIEEYIKKINPKN